MTEIKWHCVNPDENVWMLIHGDYLLARLWWDDKFRCYFTDYPSAPNSGARPADKTLQTSASQAENYLRLVEVLDATLYVDRSLMVVR